jgi:hypothetical protein
MLRLSATLPSQLRPIFSYTRCPYTLARSIATDTALESGKQIDHTKNHVSRFLIELWRGGTSNGIFVRLT